MHILGIKVDNISINEALGKAEEFLADGRQHYIVTPNPEIVLKAQKDAELKNILNNADLAIPDGFGLVLASKFLGQPLKQRVQGVDLMREICIGERFKGYKIFLLGGFNGAAKETIRQLQAVIPAEAGIQIKTNMDARFRGHNREAGEHNREERYECEENLEKAVEAISNFQPDIIFVGLGAPKQEKWIANNFKKLPSVKLAMAVGGSFDFLSGRIKRAPLFMQKIGLEWGWRLGMQPWRIGRIFRAVVIFPVKVIYSILKIKI